MSKSKLFLLCGAQGSGKSFLAERARNIYDILLNEDPLNDFILDNIGCPLVLSSDKMRGVISGDENNQECSREAFRTIELTTNYLLQDGYDVLVDATFKTEKARKPFVNIARRTNSKIICIWVNTPLNICLERNSKRDRKVPDHVIKAYFDNFQEPTELDFDRVLIYKNW